MKSFFTKRLWLYLLVLSFFMLIFQSFPLTHPSYPWQVQLASYLGYFLGAFLPWICIFELVYQLLTFRRKPKP